MQELEPTLGRVLRVWWALTWRLFVISIIVMLILGVVLGILFTAMGKQELGALWTQIIGNLVLIPIAIWGFSYLFELRFGQFRLALVAIMPEPEITHSPIPEPSAKPAEVATLEAPVEPASAQEPIKLIEANEQTEQVGASTGRRD